MTLQPIQSEFPYIREHFVSFFISADTKYVLTIFGDSRFKPVKFRKVSLPSCALPPVQHAHEEGNSPGCVDECVELVDGVRYGLVPALRVAHRQNHLYHSSPTVALQQFRLIFEPVCNSATVD
jgi:hypothetical protein